MSGNSGLRCQEAYFDKNGWILCRVTNGEGCSYQYRLAQEGTWKLSVGYIGCPIRETREGSERQENRPGKDEDAEPRRG